MTSPRKKNKCFVKTCPTQKPYAHLMCAKHWAKVPKPLQDAVYMAYSRYGALTPEWLAAADAAQDHIAGLEQAWKAEPNGSG